MSISRDPTEEEKEIVRQYVELNRDVILEYLRLQAINHKEWSADVENTIAIRSLVISLAEIICFLPGDDEKRRALLGQVLEDLCTVVRWMKEEKDNEVKP